MVNEAILAPSILAGDHACLSASLAEAEGTPGIKWIHLDIMDGHFVPNLTFGPQTIADLRPQSQLFFDTHLMLSNPHEYIEAFAKAGSQNITIHVEANSPVSETLQAIRKLGCQNGICLNPGTPIDSVKPYLGEVDLILVMTVQPGFGGQSFNEAMLEKMATLREWRQEGGYTWRIEVDGGVNLDTGRQCLDHGADTLVAGTAFFKAPSKETFVQSLTQPAA